MDELDRLNKMVNDVVNSVGAENVTQLLASIKQKSHEAKNFANCESMQEVEKHMIGCPECLANMPPIEVYWKMTHVMPDTQCDMPMHSKDRYLVN